MMPCLGRNYSPLCKLIKYKIVVFDEVYILFNFNIILKHNGMSSTKKRYRNWLEVSLCVLRRHNMTAHRGVEVANLPKR